MNRYLANFIDGSIEKISESTAKMLDVFCPYNGSILGKLPITPVDQINRAVSSSLSAYHLWKNSEIELKKEIFSKAAQIIRQRIKEIAQLEVLDTGKCIDEVESDVISAAQCLEYYSGRMLSPHGSYYTASSTSSIITRREPLGVCAGIGAWNFPFANICWKVAPALCVGNSMIFKPSPLTPLTAVLFAEIMTEAGLPPGVLNIIQGDGSAGSELCVHPAISKVSFTGSVPTGKKVAEACTQSNLKRVTLELGGKSPLIILEDAELESAVEGALLANFMSQGQVCSNATRVFVHRKIYEEFKRAVIERTEKIKIGHPMESGVRFGALISEEHLSRVLSFIDRAKKQGVKILCGGEKLNLKADLANGYFISPCIMENVSDDMEIARDEVFGPVMLLMPFENLEEAIQRANNTRFGLASGIFTRSLSHAYTAMNQLNAGICYVNTFNVYPVQMPFGGRKQSGYGRENGESALDAYSDVKSIFLETGSLTKWF